MCVGEDGRGGWVGSEVSYWVSWAWAKGWGKAGVERQSQAGELCFTIEVSKTCGKEFKLIGILPMFT